MNRKIVIFCDYCQEHHTRMWYGYEKNIAKNGRFICSRENGSIVGKSRRHYKIVDGMKQCNKCKEIKPLNQYSKDKSRREGYCYFCRECNKKRCKLYNKKITS